MVLAKWRFSHCDNLFEVLLHVSTGAISASLIIKMDPSLQMDLHVLCMGFFLETKWVCGMGVPIPNHETSLCGQPCGWLVLPMGKA